MRPLVWIVALGSVAIAACGGSAGPRAPLAMVPIGTTTGVPAEGEPGPARKDEARASARAMSVDFAVRAEKTSNERTSKPTAERKAEPPAKRAAPRSKKPRGR